MVSRVPAEHDTQAPPESTRLGRRPLGDFTRAFWASPARCSWRSLRRAEDTCALMGLDDALHHDEWLSLSPLANRSLQNDGIDPARELAAPAQAAEQGTALDDQRAAKHGHDRPA